jgi:hypothetical protein
LEGPSRTFVFDRERLYPVSEYTKRTRFVLYDNGAFELQFLNSGGEYRHGLRGKYQDQNGLLTFEWENSGRDGPWGWAAAGTLQGDSLIVRYNTAMWGADFEDAIYVLMR